MTDSEKIADWLHHYSLLKTDASRLSLFSYLKNQGDKISREALDRLIRQWLN